MNEYELQAVQAIKRELHIDWCDERVYHHLKYSLFFRARVLRIVWAEFKQTNKKEFLAVWRRIKR